MPDGYLNTPANSPGLFIGADPDWELKQQQVAQGDAFKKGLPKDANGNVNWGAASDTAFRTGNFQLGQGLLSAALQQQAVKAGLDSASALQNGMQPTAATPTSVLSTGAMPIFQNAISSIESGGKYDAQGPVTKSGDRAYGKYQVMGQNIPAWTKEILGQEMTPEQFLGSPDAQDAVFNGKFHQYLKQTGNPRDAASMWFTGRPYAQGADASDDLGTTGASYVSKFMSALPRGGQNQGTDASASAAPVQVAQNGDSDAPSSVHPYAPAAPISVGPAPPPPNSASGNLVAGPGAPSSGAAQQDQSQSVAIDPTMGGLLKGQWVGNPGGYVAALRAQAVKLGTLGVTAAATAFEKQADAVERGIERNNIVTPAMKDYAVAQQQGFRGTMMDFARAQEAQKLSAQGDPSVIRAAGQKAQAESDARNASEVAAAGQKAEQTQEGEALGKVPAQLASAANSAKLQTNLIDQMLDAANQFRMGPGASTQQNFQAKIIALGDAMGVDTSGLKGQNAGYTEFNKLAGQLTRQSIKDTGSSRAGIQEMQMVANTLPSPDMTKDGFISVATPLKGLADFTTAKQQAGEAWLNARGTMRGFEPEWNKSVTPAAFVLHRMQIDQPDLFKQTVSRMSQTPQGRDVLKNVKAGLAWGGQAGLF